MVLQSEKFIRMKAAAWPGGNEMQMIAFLNAYSDGLSGGDACFVRVAKKLSQPHSLTIVTSVLGRDLCRRSGIEANFVLTSGEQKFGSVLRTYFKRTFKTLLKLRPKRGSVFYASSDFLTDVFPSFVYSSVDDRAVWVQKIFHLTPPTRLIPSLAQRVSFQLIKRRADLIIVDNSQLKSTLEQKYDFPQEKIQVVPPGLDMESIASARPSPKRYDALFVGQLRESKGIFDLVEIWKTVHAKLPAAHLAIVGKDVQDNWKKMENSVRERELANTVKYLGFIKDDREVSSLMKSAKVLLVPSHEEGFGMVIAEALACGLPVVCYDLPVFREYFRRFVTPVPVGNAQLFASKVVEHLQSSKARPGGAEEMKQFSLNAVVDREIQLINYAYQRASS